MLNKYHYCQFNKDHEVSYITKPMCSYKEANSFCFTEAKLCPRKVARRLMCRNEEDSNICL